ncbi:MAG: V-type ATPase 116kDa subunit family protein [Desulfurococcaceae archaeon]
MSVLSKFILNKPVEMNHVTILVPRSISDKVVQILHDIGVFHIETIGKEIEEYVEKYNRLVKLLDRINSLLNNIHGIVVDVDVTRYELESIDLDLIEKDVEKIYSEINVYSSEKRILEENINTLMMIKNILIHIPRDYTLKTLVYRGKTLSTITIIGRIDSFKQLLQLYPSIHIIYSKEYEQNIVSIIMYPSSIHDEVVNRVKNTGFNILELGIDLFKNIDLNTSIGETIALIDKLLETFRNRVNEISSKIVNRIKDSLQDLCKYSIILENTASHYKTIISAMNSKYLTLITGWIPKKKLFYLIKTLESEKIPFYHEIREPVKGVDEPPTMFDNPPVIQWYEPIMKFIGIPRYWEWDPTPLLAYSFAIFFGLMLGDMGFALAIVLLTTFLLDKFVSDPGSRDYVLFKKSLVFSSIVGFIIGLISGSFFSFEIKIIRLTDVFSDPIKFLIMALIIGLIHVNIAHILTFIKSKNNKDTGTLMSELGLFIIEIFGIPYVLRNILNYSIPLIPEFFFKTAIYPIIIGIVLMIIGMIKQIGFLGLLMWLFNITGLIGDVLSYSRLAGVGLATIYLGNSFNMIANMVMNSLLELFPTPFIGLIMGGLASLIILVFGILLNTILSAIGCFVHSLRLCFIEFLSKFYEGTGYLFEPLRIVIRKRFVFE